jgi:leader peptidase (prepilin peptidase)/N-methyltransferase
MQALDGERSSLIIGLGAAALAAAAGAWVFAPAQIAASAVLAATMGAIAAEDFRRFRAPDALNLFAAVAGLVAIVGIRSQSGSAEVVAALGSAIVGAVLCGGALFLVREAFFRMRGVDGLGMGDVKLAAAGGIWLGWELFATAVMLAAIGALAFVAARSIVEGPWPRTRRIPFALYLAPAIWACWFLAGYFEIA